MRAAFFHDSWFVPGAGDKVFAPMQMGYGNWLRYLSVFDSLLIVGRLGAEARFGGAGALNESSGPRVSFLLLPNYVTPHSFLFGRSALRKAVNEAVSGVDAVIARLPSELGLMACRVARSQSIPAAVEVVGCPWDGFVHHGSVTGRVYAPLAAARLRREVGRAQHAIYVTEHFLQRRYPCSGVTANASNVDVELPARAIIRCRLSRTCDAGRKFVLGTIGSFLTKQKGIHVALRALAEVEDRLPGLEYRILGPGDPEPYLRLAARLQLRTKLTFCRPVQSGQPVLDWLDDVDLYLQPSLQEGLPRALIEAMSRGCPAIGSTTGGIPELLDGSALHAAGDYRSLARLVVKMLQDKPALQAACERNYSIAATYARPILDERRTAFWEEFGKHIQRLAAR